MIKPRIPMVGKNFGRLTVAEQTEALQRAKDRQAWYRCVCQCGKTVVVPGTSLRRGVTKSCGCLRQDITVQRNREYAVRVYNLEGRRFGKLLVESRLEERKYGQQVWSCRCDCGNMYNAAAYHLVSGAVKSCGCLPTRRPKDLTGLRFGSLTVVSLTNDRKSNGGAVWNCRCDCGIYTNISASNLTRGKAVSCGCARREDLRGRRFGKLHVLRLGERSGAGVGSYWVCRCDCGKECEVQAAKLKSGHTRSCGCSHDDFIMALTGRRFGKLTVVADSGQRRAGSGGVVWRCKCDCGQEKLVRQDALVSGRTLSCGCISSKGNAKVADLLRKAGLSFLPEYTPEDMEGRYRFDFAVLQEGRITHLIEYDGNIHFGFSGSGWDTEARFQKTLAGDRAKNRYCQTHNIPLIRIPHTAFQTLTIQDLLLGSNYLVKFPTTPANTSAPPQDAAL